MMHFRVLVVVMAGITSVTTAAAAPGDVRTVQGTLDWPAAFSVEPFVVVRGDDGVTYYADLTSAQQRVTGALRGGDRVSLVGIEGGRPHELAALVLGSGDAALAGLPPLPARPAPPATSSPAGRPPTAATAPPSTAPSLPGALPRGAAEPARPAGDERQWRRVSGTVHAVAPGTSLKVRTEGGRIVTVDVSRLGSRLQMPVRVGDEVTVFVVPERDGRLIAVGYTQSAPLSPSALPKPTR